MTDDRDNPLLVAVEDLTKPLRSKVMQGDALTPVTLPSLLQQLDDAIFSSMGSTASGASLAFEGAPLNTGALFAAMKISSQIRDWCQAVKVRPVKNTSKDLTAWFAAFTLSDPQYEVEMYRAKVLRGWAGSIRGMLNPPRERELGDDCPICGADSWYDPRDGHKYAHPLIVRYRLTDDDMVNDARGHCRSCETVWGVRELAFAIEEREAG
jgi:hypothetical protein